MADRIQKPLRAYLLELWQLLFSPALPKTEAEQRRQAQFLYMIVILLTILAIAIVIINPNTTTILTQNIGLYLTLISPLGGALLFATLRRRHYRLAAILLIAASSCNVAIIVSIDPAPRPFFALIYLTIPVLISSIVLSTRFTLFVILAQLAWFALLPVMGQQPITSANAELGYYLMASLLILFSAAHRNLLEHDRRAELERRVQERTAALTESIQQHSATQIALERERNLLRTLIDTVPDIIFVLDREGRYVITNRAHSEAVVKIRPEETTGKRITDLIDSEAANAWVVQDQHVMETDIPLINSVESQTDENGQTRWFLVNKVPLHDEHGHVTGLVGVSRDITTRKQAEDALQNINLDLERRVVERTIELSQANQLLLQQMKERLAVEEQLRYQANLLQNVSDAIISTTLDFEILSWNEAAATIYGWRPDEVIGKKINEVLSTEYADGQTASEVRRTFTAYGVWQGEVLQKRRDGTIINVLSSVTQIRDINNQPIGIVAVNRDITRRKLTEAAEREQRLLARSLIASTSALSSTLELDEVLERIFEYLGSIIPHDTASIMLIESGVAQIVHGHGFVELGFDIATITNQQFPIEQFANLRQMYHTKRAMVIANTSNNPNWRAETVTGAWVQSYIGAPIIIDDEVIGFLNLDSGKPYSFTDAHADYLQTFANQAGIAIRNARLYQSVRNYADDLEARVAERTAELERERVHLQTILNGMTEGVIGVIFDENGAPVARYVNSALTEMTGKSAENWDFKLLRPLNMTEQEFETTSARIFETMLKEGKYSGEYRIRGRDNAILDVHVTSAYFSTAGRMAGTVTILRDITQEKALQEQKSRFVANASHELRTPLTNLTTRLYLLRRQPERFEEHLSVIEAVTQRMRRLVEDLLDHARFERGQIALNLQTVDLRKIVKDVVELQRPEADKKQIRLILTQPDAALQAEADPERITQVITNLLSNAIQYTPPEGLVTIDMQLEQVDGNPCAQVSVTDNGPGIDAVSLPNIFQPFYRASETSDGTGLGLSISREIARMHGGDITVSSTPGSGARFTFCCPLRQLSPP